MTVKEMMEFVKFSDYVIRTKEKEYLCMYGYDINGDKAPDGNDYISYTQIPEEIKNLKVTDVFSASREYKGYEHHDHDYSLVVIKAE